MMRLASCHSEGSEESLIMWQAQRTKDQPEMFRFAQHDKQGRRCAGAESLDTYCQWNSKSFIRK